MAMQTSLPPWLPSSIRTLILTTTPLPQPSHPDDVLVKVHTTSPCAGELWWMRDYPAAIPADELPVPCSDLCGQVVAAPAGSGFRARDEVYARVSPSRPGCAREYTLARTNELAPKPAPINFAEAAAAPLSALTAWQALFVQAGNLDAAALRGDADARRRNGSRRVLVTGAAGGVGSWVVQLAALAGAGAVVAVCSAAKAEAARRLGATEVVDYKAKPLPEWIAEDRQRRECDLVIAVVGGTMLPQCWHVVRDGGRLAKCAFFIVEPLGSNLREITPLIDAGKVRPVVDSVFGLQDIEAAFERVETGKAQGKVVIQVDDLLS
ncbi:Reticulon-4-interacting protein 1, mitochondrial [Lipomyces kononenkoae]|uniref:Reticulon-4-interacting protein 1, mitochondrial n=1 Tax=Lipomyces kononenkoae TaxID=34357 RepID=A0ACC3T4D7_LIPKO